MDYGWTSDKWLLGFAGFAFAAVFLIVLTLLSARGNLRDHLPAVYLTLFAALVTVMIFMATVRYDTYGTLMPKSNSPSGNEPAEVAEELGPPTDNVPPTAMSDPTALPVESRIAYRDDFDDPTASQLELASTNPSRYHFDIIDGEYVIEKIDPDVDAIAKYLPGTYRDVVVAVDARLTGELKDRYSYVTCRRDPEATSSTHYRLSVNAENESFSLALWEDGEETVLASGPRRDVIRHDNSVNRIELRCIGNEITAIINGDEVARFDDATLSEGWVAIGTGIYANKTGTVEARFDNLEVTTVGDSG